MPASTRFAAGLGAALLLAEAGIAFTSLFCPRVNAFYASYYIADQRSCWLQPAAAAAARQALRAGTIAVAALPPRDACYLLADGWSDVERWGVWSMQRGTALDLPGLPGKSRLTLTVIGYSPHNRQSVRIWVNGVPMGSHFVPTGMRSQFTITVPGGSDDLVITFRVRHPSRPHGADTRRLGLGLIALNWS